MFAEFAERKTREAETAKLHPLRTVIDSSFLHQTVPIGNAWTRRLFDGPFHLWRVPSGPCPAVSLVFVQSADGNTRAADPLDLGAGDTDKHLIYEGLSRVAADAVLAGAATAAGPDVFFSVWHPELVALRKTFGLPRHPAQVVLTRRGRIDMDSGLLFNVRDVHVYVLGTEEACVALAQPASSRPWVTLMQFDGEGVVAALEQLRRDSGIRRISAVGGAATAAALLDAGVVQDVYLTTTSRSAGEPGTPFHPDRARLGLDAIVRKRSTDPGAPFSFEHLGVYGRGMEKAE